VSKSAAPFYFRLSQYPFGDGDGFETPISPDAISYLVAKGGEPAAHEDSGDNPKWRFCR
jgi:hypothetical protein